MTLKIKLNNLLKEEDDDKILEIFYQLHEEEGGIYSIGLALHLMTAPFDDSYSSNKVLIGLFNTPFEYLSALFSAYIYISIEPIDRSFIKVLEKYPNNSESNYYLAEYYDFHDNIEESKKYLKKSLSLKGFPSNRLLELKLYADQLTDNERKKKFSKIENEIINKMGEIDYHLGTNIDDFIMDYFNEYILQTSISSINWDSIKLLE
ncbi:MAG: hypothetical protein COB02_01290 [Candidatus Cloacimonadota bacterium]|nr:MAG: hypothetical protein COB02_01290 [Candidatus Cloacimonadota bacterium]